jgi:predicted TIM-barrel fold metal-dependent hydrolase
MARQSAALQVISVLGRHSESLAMNCMLKVYFFALCISACAHGPRHPLHTDGSETAIGNRPTEVTHRPTEKIQLADHHVHVFSPAAAQWLEHELDLPPLPPLTVDQLMPVLQKDGVVKAAVLSNAYFFSAPGAGKPDALKTHMAENDWVAAAVAKYPDRLVGFFAVNPLADSAAGEIDRCARRQAFVGLKLHLANSGVDLRDPAHIDRLIQVFDKANALGLAIVIHMRTKRADYGRQDAQIFIDRVLPTVPDVPIQIAHVAGWGGYDEATDSALSAFADAIEHGKITRRNLYFDVSAVVRPVRGGGQEGSRGSLPAGAASQEWRPEQRYERLVDRLQTLGLGRVLFGTDWPDWTPLAYAADLAEHLPLEGHELDTLLANRAPWLR